MIIQFNLFTLSFLDFQPPYLFQLYSKQGALPHSKDCYFLSLGVSSGNEVSNNLYLFCIDANAKTVCTVLIPLQSFFQ